MGYTLPLLLIGSAVLTASGKGAPVLVGRNQSLALALEVVEVVEAGTLDVTIETASSKTAMNWRTLGAFPQASAAGVAELALSGSDAWVRARWELSQGAQFAASASGAARCVLRSSAATVAAGAGAAVDVAQFRALRLALDVTAAPPGGELTAMVETAQVSTATTWRTVGTFAIASAASEKVLTVAGLDRFARMRWTQAGGSFTWSVAGTAHLIYATPADRARYGIRGGSIPDVDEAHVAEALIATAPTMSAYLQRWEHPLLSWDDLVTEGHVALADMLLLTNRGAEPGAQGTQLYVARYKEFVGEPPTRLGKLDLIANKKITPAIVDSVVNEPMPHNSFGFATYSRPARGWGSRRR